MKRGAVDVVADIAKSDAGTADLLAEALIYEALCDEIDQVRPWLERDGARYVAKRAQGALEEIAKRYPIATGAEKAELEALAEELALTFTVAKDDSQKPVTESGRPFWETEPRNQRGRWTKGAIDALALMTGNSDKSRQVQDRAGQHMDAIAAGDRYNRARALGNALGQVGHHTGRADVTAVGHLTRLAGEIGPEASRVFGRGLTRMSYRYRGTERRPDSAVAAQSRQIGIAARDNDQLRLAELNKLGVDALSRRLPQMDLARLSLESGQLPPSRGIIFDAQGNAVTEAVGINGDHYLPFDLKNLKRLRGGQYVRTRATGGLTDEDVYTGLMTGARQVTVVSNSGVFSMEFDPALRGGRRYSDKARGMVDRYSAMLDRINQGDLTSQDIPPREQMMMRREEYERANGNEDLGDKYFKERLRKERLTRRFATKDDEELSAEALERAKTEMRSQRNAGQIKGVSTRTLAQRQHDIFRDLKKQQRDQAVRYYRLDGEGYRDAQRALAQEFPFFVRDTQYLPLDQYLLAGNRVGEGPLPPRVGADIGYTPRNALGPREQRRESDRKDEDSSGRTTDKPKSPNDSGGVAVGWAAPAEPGSDSLGELAQLLNRSLLARSRYNDMTPSDNNSEKDAELLSGEEWAHWALAQKGGPTGVARWLLDPKTSMRHLEKAKESLEVLAGAKPIEGFDKFDEAGEFVDHLMLSRKPFAERATGDPVLAVPEVENPAPPPIPEVYDLGPDLKKIHEFAFAHDDVGQEAQDALTPEGEKKLVQAIRDNVARIHVIQKWKKDSTGLVDEDDKPSPSHGVTAEMANQWDPKNPEAHPIYQDLERQQKAWALARAAQVAAWRQQRAVPDLGPKEVGKRDPLPPRLVLHRPVAKRRAPSSPRR